MHYFCKKIYTNIDLYQADNVVIIWIQYFFVKIILHENE